MAAITERRVASRDAPPRRRLDAGAELVTMLLGAWMTVGIFVDGWAHNNLEQLETFFTPWHALFYSGFTATAAWIVWQTSRRRRRGQPWLSATPLGYGLGLLGVVVFAAAGLGDLVWHSVFGIEQDLEALYSPSHILLFVGGALVLSSPLRAAWAADVDDEPSLRAFLPVVLSLTLTTTSLAFMFMYWSASWHPPAAADVTTWAELSSTENLPLAFYVQNRGLASILATNLLLLAPVLLLVKRWLPPLGTFTILFPVVAVLTAAMDEFAAAELLPAFLFAGVAADLLVRRWRPSPIRPQASWALGVVIPVVLWTTYFLLLAAGKGIGWGPEMWTGTVVWTAVLGGLFALLMLPPTPSGRSPGSTV